MTLPEIKDELNVMQDQLECMAQNLRRLISEIGRRPQLNRAPKTSAPMTPELTARIRAYKANFPTHSQQAIGKIFNVNSGRVSVALRGKRT